MAALTSIILAAGEGTRLRPHTVACPKCIVPVNGRPLIHYQLDLESERQRLLDEIAELVSEGA